MAIERRKYGLVELPGYDYLLSEQVGDDLPRRVGEVWGRDFSHRVVELLNADSGEWDRLLAVFVDRAVLAPWEAEGQRRVDLTFNQIHRLIDVATAAACTCTDGARCDRCIAIGRANDKPIR